ncbi:MAG: SH3 domain-containing protein [Kouleothrix sp.]|jgi:hypothetical protein|nr:SH3 domain-containing protein [Kouleothrix sp.]
MNARTMGWIGYDWFKLIVAIILLLLLLTLWLSGAGGAPATVAPAATTVPAPAVALSAPTLSAPATGTLLQPGKVTFSGSATPNSTVQITIDGKPAGTAKAGADGKWSFDATLDTPGDHQVLAQALDDKGAVAASASPLTFNVAAPAVALSAPTLSAPAAGTQLQPGKVTFSGSATPNSSVQVMIDGKPAGTAKAGADGKWSLDATLDTPGDHQVLAQALDDKGTIAAESAGQIINIGAPAVAIAAPTINAPDGPITSSPFTLSGTGTPGAQLEIIVDGQPAGTVTVGPDGTWSLPISLPDGEHAVSARAVDAAGKELAASSPITLTFGGAAAPVAGGATPVIGFPADGASLSTGEFTMTGTGAPGSDIEILDSDKVIGTVKVGADGTWSLPITPSGGTAAYSTRVAGSTDVAAKPIRVSFGAGQAAGCTSLAVNCDAWVTRKGGLSLRMRAGAGTGARILIKLPVGTQLTLLEGPTPANDRNWWRVRTVGGREGWVAGEELVLQPD